MKLTNNARRRLGIPGRPAIILEPDQTVEITDDQLKVIKANRTVERWLDSGILTVGEPVHKVKIEKQPKVIERKTTGMKERDKREDVPLPDGITGEGTELYNAGGGWYQVYVNGFKVTDKSGRKDEAESLSTEYEE